MDICPQRRDRRSSHATEFLPDFEALKFFMNREAFKRGIRHRYYTVKALAHAYHKKYSRSSSVQEQATEDLLNPQEVDFATLQFAHLRAEISHLPNETRHKWRGCRVGGASSSGECRYVS
jgi:hypothetical protein